MAKRAHNAPHRAQQPQERRAAHRNRQQNQPHLELERFLRHRILQRAFDVFHAFERNVLLAAVAVGILQPRIQLQAARLIHRKERAPLRLHPAVEEIKNVLLGAVFGVEILVELFGPAHLHDLGNHDRPGNDRQNEEAINNALAFGCGLPPHIKQFHLIRPDTRCR